MTVHNGLDDALAAARTEGRAALMPYLTAGFPDPDRFVDLAAAVFEAGADALEIGVPFSDPLLDGPTIQRSTQRALDLGITPARCLAYAQEIHSRTRKPLLLMGAFNPIFAYRLDRFCTDASTVGVTALLIPDVPIEETEEVREAAGRAGMHVIQFLAPTSTPDRLERVCSVASGFIYCISIAGVTGARRSVADTARPLVERVHACTDVPVAVGFGISTPEAACEVATFADGVIVGAALIDVLSRSEEEEASGNAARFVGSLREALDRAAHSDTGVVTRS